MDFVGSFSVHPQNYILNKNYETIIIQVQLYPWNYVPMNLRNIDNPPKTGPLGIYHVHNIIK